MFHLRKWYLDCTAESGEVVIVYWAAVRWNLIRFRWGGVLHKPGPVEPTTQRSTFRPGSKPEQRSGRIRFASEGIGLDGIWRPDAPSHDCLLLEGDDGYIRWSCLAPNASCRMELAGRTIEGRGYAELLEITIPPWKLPISELRWGRWLTESDSLVWIDWRGWRPLSLVLVDGAEVAGTVEDDAVSIGGGSKTELDRAGVIREGELRTTVLGDIPVIKGLVPAAIARTHETKWLSRGIRTGGVAGWAVHERVCFGP